MPGPADLFAQIQAGNKRNNNKSPALSAVPVPRASVPTAAATTATTSATSTPTAVVEIPKGRLYAYDAAQEAFVFSFSETDTTVRLDLNDSVHNRPPDNVGGGYGGYGGSGSSDLMIVVPLAPCVYRMTDYTYAKRQAVSLHRIVLKLGVLRCLARECHRLNELLWQRFHPILLSNDGSYGSNGSGSRSLPEMTPLWKEDENEKKKTDIPTSATATTAQPHRSPYYYYYYVGTLEEEELGKARFMELLSNCGVYQKVSELILQRGAQVADAVVKKDKHSDPTMTVSSGAVNSSSSSTGSSNDGSGNDDDATRKEKKKKNPFGIPQVRVEGLDEFLAQVEALVPALALARDSIATTQTVSFHPGLGELYCPGSQLLCYPDGMEGSPLGCSVVQCWYDEETNPAVPHHPVKRKFVLVVEFIVSVGPELVFVAASDVYPEFHDPHRHVPMKDLSHRKLWPHTSAEDRALLQRLQERGEFYASVATQNHYLEYDAHSFFPIISGSAWRSPAVRPLTKGGRVMVDVTRGILEGHYPVRSSSTSNSGTDGLSDTVKEAIKLFEQSKRTGVAVPFRTCILPEFVSYRGNGSSNSGNNSSSSSSKNGKKNLAAEPRETILSDRSQLWQAWPMLTGFSFTARVWGKLLLAMPKVVVGGVGATTTDVSSSQDNAHHVSVNVTLSPGGRRPALPGSVSPRRPSCLIQGVQVGGLGGEGSAGNCGYIQFQERAFDQLVLAEEKKELIRAVARNAGSGGAGGHSTAHDDVDDIDDDDDDESNDIGLDVVANKGGASIFLLHGRK
jgi:hypothetical protein